MVKLNHHYQKLKNDYLFLEVEKRVQTLLEKDPFAPLIHLGIGDVTHPLRPTIAKALQDASIEMGSAQFFQGYGPSQGYSFLREAIAKHEYANCPIQPDEIFISNGAKCDLGNFQELFDAQNRVAVLDPSYPVYLDVAVMSGRTKPLLKSGLYGGVTYLTADESNQFQPKPPTSHVDLIFLCSPNNPTGVALSQETLQKFVDYAKKEGAILFFDGAYEAYIQSKNTPRSIYEVEGACEVAVEIRSFSKSASFTGLRCSYSVVPHQLQIFDAGKTHSLHALWKRRHNTKFNGAGYPVQKAAAATYTPEGQKEIKEVIALYQQSASFLLKGLKKLGATVYGGVDAPYLWWKTPNHSSSWDFFQKLLDEAQIVTTPGKGFGVQGEGFVRLSAFQDIPSLRETLIRLEKIL